MTKKKHKPKKTGAKRSSPRKRAVSRSRDDKIAGAAEQADQVDPTPAADLAAELPGVELSAELPAIGDPRPPGRPTGSTSIARDTVVAVPSRCKACGSTQRAAYRGKPRRLVTSGLREGVKYNVVTWRPTKCTNCGQHRVDKSFEMLGGVE